MSGSQKQQQNKQTQVKVNAKKTPSQSEQSLNLEQLVSAPETMHSEEILAAQQQVGNQVVQRALGGKKNRDAMTDDQGYLKNEINDAIQSKRGGGSSLPDSVREVASKNLNHDFSDVRIHTDEKANELSKSINARAFTIGKDIFFKKGVFSPGSRAGRETLMHELTHVVQQSGGSGASGRLKLGAPDTRHEKQADKVGKANSGVDSIKSASNSAVQRKSGVAINDDAGLEQEADAMGVQRMEEEELQMQEEEEEAVQMQEEEEVQMQDDDDEDWDTDPDHEHKEEETPRISREKMSEMGGQLIAGMKKGETRAQKKRAMVGVKSFDKSRLKPTQTQDKSAPNLTMTDKEKGSLSEKVAHGKTEDTRRKLEGVKTGLKHVETRDRSAPNLKMSFGEKKELTKKVQVGKLTDTMSDTSKSTEDAEKAEEQLKLHTRSASPFKASYARQARQKRYKNLKEKAQTGDEDAIKKFKETEGKTSGFDKFMASSGKERGAMAMKGIGSGLKGALGLGKRFFSSGLDTMKEQLFGKEEKKEEPKKEAPAPVTVNVGGGGGGGGGGGFEMLEKYITENQQLKAKIAELEKEKVAQ